jgi:hypothetical protein
MYFFSYHYGCDGNKNRQKTGWIDRVESNGPRQPSDECHQMATYVILKNHKNIV